MTYTLLIPKSEDGAEVFLYYPPLVRLGEAPHIRLTTNAGKAHMFRNKVEANTIARKWEEYQGLPRGTVHRFSRQTAELKPWTQR